MLAPQNGLPNLVLVISGDGNKEHISRNNVVIAINEEARGGGREGTTSDVFSIIRRIATLSE